MQWHIFCVCACTYVHLSIPYPLYMDAYKHAYACAYKINIFISLYEHNTVLYSGYMHTEYLSKNTIHVVISMYIHIFVSLYVYF